MADISMTAARAAAAPALWGFPFRTEFSLAPLVRYWERELAEGDSSFATAARALLEKVRQTPALAAPVVDPAAVRAHDKLLDALMLAVFSPTFREDSYAAALLPFKLQSFYATPGFARLLTDADGALQFRMDADVSLVLNVRILAAYSLILERVYGIDLGVEYPWVAIVNDPDSGLDRYFKLIMSRRFLEVDVVGTAPPITDEALRRLRSHLADPVALTELLPPDRFVIRGFGVVQAIEVTDQEVLSAIERDLIEKESIVSTPRFRGLRDKLRALLRRPELELGVAAVQGDRVLMLNFGAEFEHACIFADSTHLRLGDFAGLRLRAGLAGATPAHHRGPADLSAVGRGSRTSSSAPATGAWWWRRSSTRTPSSAASSSCPASRARSTCPTPRSSCRSSPSSRWR